MQASALSFLLVSLLCGCSSAFTVTLPATRSSATPSCVATSANPRVAQNEIRYNGALHSSNSNSNTNYDSQEQDDEVHPAVEGWPAKFVESGGSPDTRHKSRVISDDFEVHAATESELKDLDVFEWPTWTTGDKPKWDVGNRIVDKEMPYGELSYMVSGSLEIVPQSTGVPILVQPGDLVTFPKGFVASWKVVEELTWHYYLY